MSAFSYHLMSHAAGWAFVFTVVLALLADPGQAQSIRKMEKQAINRSRVTLVMGDTVQRFATTRRRPRAKAARLYYWQGPDRILQTAGSYNGRLLEGPYQLTNREGQLLGSGTFKKGLKTGTWRTWQPDGTPVTSSRWRRGRQLGSLQRYDSKGQPLAEPAKQKQTQSAAATTPAATPWWRRLLWWKKPGKETEGVQAIPAAEAVPKPTAKPKRTPKKQTSPAAPKPAGT